jgi:hypothetical protein
MFHTFCSVVGTLERALNLWTFLWLGVPQASVYFLKRAGSDVATVDMMHFGRVFFTKK